MSLNEIARNAVATALRAVSDKEVIYYREADPQPVPISALLQQEIEIINETGTVISVKNAFTISVLEIDNPIFGDLICQGEDNWVVQRQVFTNGHMITVEVRPFGA